MSEISITVDGGAVQVPVTGGHYLYAVWDVPDRFGFPGVPGVADGHW